MYKNCREELLAVMTEYVKEKGENEFTRAEAIAAKRRAGTKYTPGTVSAGHNLLNRIPIIRGWLTVLSAGSSIMSLFRLRQAIYPYHYKK